MAFIARIFVSILVFLAVYFFSYWLVFVQIVRGENQFQIAMIPAVLTAAFAAYSVWRVMGAANDGIFATTVCWAAVAGAIGFCGGFLGPMILTPGANQGPLLGLFITGPLGFIGGGVAGLVVVLRRRLSGVA